MPIEYTRDDAVGYITLNRPPANSYDDEGMRELAACIEAAAADTEARVVIVRSVVERFFSAGADVRFLTEESVETNLAMVDLAHATLGKMARIPKLFIAQIGGHCLGGGLEIALACDFRFGGEGKYSVGLTEANLGLIPGNGGTQRLSRLIGPTKALDLMATARRLTPEEARQFGIFDRLFPAEELAAQTRAYAEGVASSATGAIGALKRAVYEGRELPLDAALQLERSILEPVLRAEEIQEGVRAFKEKRKPDFHREGGN
jgi:enoyl-CoA hydratase/carnithine racemase